MTGSKEMYVVSDPISPNNLHLFVEVFINQILKVINLLIHKILIFV